MKVKLLFPPIWDTSHPHLSLPSLSANLKKNGIENEQIDLNIMLWEMITNKNIMQDIVERNVIDIENSKERIYFDCFIDKVDEIKRTIREHWVDIYFNKNDIEYADSTRLIGIVQDFIRKHSLSIYGPISADNILKIIEYEDIFSELFRKYFLSGITSKNPEIIGISIPSYRQTAIALKFAKIIKENSPKIHLVVGGPITTDIVTQLEDYQKLFSVFDSMVVGDGETSLVKLVEGIQISDLRNVPNLVYLDGNKIVHNTIFYEDMDSLPTPSFDGLPMQLYMSRPIFPLQTSRGCYWNKCTFCDYRSTIGCGSYRERSIHNVINDIKYLVDTYSAKYFTFKDNEINPARMNILSEEILKNRLNILWKTYARCEAEFTDELFGKMYKAGCRRIFFGVESGSDRILKLMNKGINTETMKDVIKRSRKNGMINSIAILIGFPTETEHDMNETIKFISGNIENIDIMFAYKFVFSTKSGIFQNKEFFPSPEKLVQYYKEIDEKFNRFFLLLPDNIKRSMSYHMKNELVFHFIR